MCLLQDSEYLPCPTSWKSSLIFLLRNSYVDCLCLQEKACNNLYLIKVDHPQVNNCAALKSILQQQFAQSVQTVDLVPTFPIQSDRYSTRLWLSIRRLLYFYRVGLNNS